jgi:purine-nucleoside phosphorylase
MIRRDGDRKSEKTSRCSQAVEFLLDRWPSCHPRAGIILGTGSGQLSEQIMRELVIPFRDIPHFPCSTALGHRGQLVCGKLGGISVVALDGRCHLYEGYSCEEVTLPVAVMHGLGVELLLVTNASGGINPRLRSGDLMVLADHIDLMGQRTACLSVTPGLPSRSGRRTPYDPDLIELAQEVARSNGFTCSQGTYVAVLGPNYETRAEYRWMRRIGGDAVGMSTVPEVLAAGHLGLKVLAISTVTNVACPDVLQSTAGEDVVDIAATAEPKLRKVVMGVLERYFAVSCVEEAQLQR